MTRWRRLLRAKSSTDLTVVALVLCACAFFFRQLNQRAAVHRLQGSAAGDDDDGDGGQLLEISLNDGQTRQQQQPPRAASHNIQVPLQQSQHEVDPRIMHIGDFRSADCRGKESRKSDVSITIAVEYSDYEFYDIKNTVDSCVLVHASAATPHIKQIVAVDSSTLDYIIDEARDYFASLPKTTLLRSADVRLSSAQARTAALSVATGDVLVFVDSAVICAAGWLEPLIDAVLRHPDSIVSPHLDRLRDPVSLEYEPTNDSLVGGVSWDLAVRMRGSPAEMYTDDGCCIRSPALRGNVMAVRRALFKQLGGYDTMLAAEMNDAGHNVELSLRAWTCGVDVYTVPCSRVGVLNLRDPVKVTDMNAVLYIATLWLKPRLSVVLSSAGHTGSSDNKLTRSLSAEGRSTARCDATPGGRDAEWFLGNVATDLILPSPDAVKFGMLRVNTGRCARLLTATGRIALQDCLQNVYVRPPKEMTFELTREGQLKVIGLCLTVQNNAYILAKDCAKSETRQQWKYTWHEELYNTWSRYCATHVTDPDTSAPADRQIVMAQDCSGDGKSKDDTLQFRAWQFIAN